MVTRAQLREARATLTKTYDAWKAATVDETGKLLAEWREAQGRWTEFSQTFLREQMEDPGITALHCDFCRLTYRSDERHDCPNRVVECPK